MEMNRWGQSKIERGQTMRRAVGMVWQRRAGKQTQPAELGRCRQPQPADDLPGTGLEATQQPAVGRPRSKTTARRCWPASRRAVHVGRGSAVVLATQEAGSDLPNRLSPSHLSPLPVTVSTHPLNFEKNNLAPTYFCCFYSF